MKKLTKLLTVVIAAMVLTLSATTVFAAPSPSKVKIASATATKATYNGKSQSAKLTVTATVNGKKVTLKNGVDYKIVSAPAKCVNAGKYTITIQGIGKYTGTQKVTYVINKKKCAAVVSIANKDKTIKKSNLNKKSKTVKISIKNKAKGSKVKYGLGSTARNLRKYVTIGKNGKVTIKKGAPKARYRVTVKITNKNYTTKKKVVVMVVK